MNRLKKEIVYSGMNTERINIDIVKLDNKYIGITYSNETNTPKVYKFDNKKEVDKYLLDNKYQFRCDICNKKMNYGTFDINTAHYLSKDKTIDICQSCWSVYTTDINDHPNILLEEKLLKDKIEKL